ncbi:MAG: hypothetical protein ABSA21_12200 [Candidatus Limnocylindrales bacterium]
MFGELETTVDPDLGECTVFRGSRTWIPLAILGVVILLVVAVSALQGPGALITATPSQWALMAVVGLLFCGLAVWNSRMQLVIAERGFRYVRPLRRVQAPWSMVGNCTVEATHGNRRLVVPLSQGGRQSNVYLPALFSASLTQICDLMNARRTTFGTTVPDRSGTKGAPRKERTHRALARRIPRGKDK